MNNKILIVLENTVNLKCPLDPKIQVEIMIQTYIRNN